ncbi:hypothetical protein EDD21DRAFT_361915 [Dissophora ornata]|nr:hypothetical protein EDD21DRAFT_361915 [Dissophora ornata]
MGTGSGGVPSFYLSLDRTRQPNVPNLYDSRDEDDEDKDKDRYMPSVLLNSATTMKVYHFFISSTQHKHPAHIAKLIFLLRQPIKLEPLVDGPRGKTAWDSEPFQSIEPMREAAPRLPQHLIGEDAPPIDTLYDIARKEKLYSRPLTEVSVSNQDRPDVDMGRLGESSSTSTALRNGEIYESIITYGFPEELASAMMQEFKFFGEIARFETGYYGRAGAESFNWLKIKFRDASAARRAVSRHLKPVGGFVVGVHPCSSFSDWMSHRMGTATEQDQSLGLAQSVARDLTESEARDVLAGVDALLKLRAQGGARGADLPMPPQEQARMQSQTEQLKRLAPHLTLLAETDRGMMMIGENLTEAHRLFPSSLNPMAVTETLNATPTGFGFGFGGHMPTSSAMEEDGDEEMALILGHSLTSGGSIARTQERNELRRSRQRAQQQQEEAKSRPNPDRGILAEPTQEEMMARSTFQRPIHPSGFASSLRPNLESSSSGSQQRYTLSRPSFAASNSDDNSLFSASAGVLLETSDSASATSNGAGDTSLAAFNHVQKRQRLEAGSAPRSVPASIQGYGEDGVPLSLFGTGRDRVAALAKANTGATQEANGVISSLITMAKKRLFWG